MIRLTRYPICVYCGVRVQTKAKHEPHACRRHFDLLSRDPYFADPLDQWALASAVPRSREVFRMTCGRCGHRSEAGIVVCVCGCSLVESAP